jgi:short-subunit dehydrogenase
MLNPKLVDWRDRRVWLIGASSGIGAALARELDRRGARLAISARRSGKLEELRQTLAGQAHLSLPLDVTHAQSLSEATESLVKTWGEIDLVVWLVGDYVAMGAQTFDLSSALKIAEVNYLALLKGLATLLPQFLRQGNGGLVLVSSVAGFRGLPKALAYGPTKAAMINLAEVLYLDLHERGIGVWLVNPGFVETPLTAGNQFKMPAIIAPEQAALALLTGLSKGGFEVHFPRRFTTWLKLARMLPYSLYFKLIGRITESGH